MILTILSILNGQKNISLDQTPLKLGLIQMMMDGTIRSKINLKPNLNLNLKFRCTCNINLSGNELGKWRPSTMYEKVDIRHFRDEESTNLVDRFQRGR